MKTDNFFTKSKIISNEITIDDSIRLKNYRRELFEFERVNRVNNDPCSEKKEFYIKKKDFSRIIEELNRWGNFFGDSLTTV